MEFLEHHPGLLFVVATLLPLASFVLLLLVAAKRTYYRRSPEGSLGHKIYQLLGGDNPGRGAAYVATGAIALAFVCSFTGFVIYLGGHAEHEKDIATRETRVTVLRDARAHLPESKKKEREERGKQIVEAQRQLDESKSHWEGRIYWAGVGAKDNDKQPGTLLQLGYKIDGLAAIMFVMVTLIATLIHIFSIGYMSEELGKVVEDHQVHTADGHLHRRGRFGQFFMYLSLFCFSMLNLVLADNLFQVFVSWELVGICSFLLIGFYYERTSASNAANKAFITNRVGDAGFIIGLLILWTHVGTFNFDEIFQRVRSPMVESHLNKLPEAGKIVTANRDRDSDDPNAYVIAKPGEKATHAVLFPRDMTDHFGSLKPGNPLNVDPKVDDGEAKYSVMPYWLLVAAGVGIFLGCVGKSAQFPLQVWLPDAMEGPTPVSALIHAATMVAAGVYLVGRTFPLFTAEALLVIAYTGAITLFVAATIAIVQTDIKKVLAYSTVSQLGFMMLALGLGGWVAGLFHLVTHAFFKALLFLCSGAVIYGCHHEQEMTKMGGLYKKMPITAITMLIGCLAIAGAPLFSGWYSKDAMLAHAMGYSVVFKQHFLLFLLPLLTAGITTFYMFRMWFMTFTGEPRDHHVADHAHEAPRTITVPLVVLAFFSVVVAWGWPVWNPEASWLEHQIHHAMPRSVQADFGVVPKVDQAWVDKAWVPLIERDPETGRRGWRGKMTEATWPGQEPKTETLKTNVRKQAHDLHAATGYLVLAIALVAFLFAYLVYYRRALDPAEAKEQVPWLYNFLKHKWYFDELYSALLVRPALAVAGWAKAFDTKVIDGFVDGTGRTTVRLARDSGRFDLGVIDGLANLTARAFYGLGSWFRNFQTGYLRSYVVLLVVAAVSIWAVLSAVFMPAGTP